MASRIAIAPDHGKRVLGPPEKWRPRALTTMEKIEVVIRQEGKEPGGAKLMALEGIQFDHHPALQRRRWDEAAQDTIPPACDLAFIVALNKPTHAEKTTKEDIPEIAKTKRLEGKTCKRKPGRKIQSAGFDKRKRKFG